MNAQEKIESVKGLHSFVAYEGDILRDEKGNVLNKIVYKSPVIENLIVNNGKNLTLDRLAGITSNPISAIGVGTDLTAAAVTQSQLNPSVAGSVFIKVFDALPIRSAQTVTYQTTFLTTEANFNWNEGGTFNGVVNATSTLFNRTVIGPFNKTLAVSIVYQISLVQS